MPRQFPYVAAAAVTAAVGSVTTFVRAAQVAVPHVAPHVLVSAVAAMVPSPPVAPPPVAAAPGNAANTPTSTGPAFAPGNVALQVGADAAPAVTRAAAFAQPGLNQPGTPPFSEFFVSQQTAMGQPGQPDFYQGTNNPSIVQANEGAVPARAYPDATTPETGVSPAATKAFGFATTQGSNVVGFYNGFGPGQPDFGFYKGFTAPTPP